MCVCVCVCVSVGVGGHLCVRASSAVCHDGLYIILYYLTVYTAVSQWPRFVEGKQFVLECLAVSYSLALSPVCLH